MESAIANLIKCPFCSCCFCTKHDLNRHLTVCGRNGLGWQKSRYDNSEICPSIKDFELKLAIQKEGKVNMGMYVVTLSGDGKWLKRKLQEQP